MTSRIDEMSPRAAAYEALSDVEVEPGVAVLDFRGVLDVYAEVRAMMPEVAGIVSRFVVAYTSAESRFNEKFGPIAAVVDEKVGEVVDWKIGREDAWDFIGWLEGVSTIRDNVARYEDLAAWLTASEKWLDIDEPARDDTEPMTADAARQLVEGWHRPSAAKSSNGGEAVEPEGETGCGGWQPMTPAELAKFFTAVAEGWRPPWLDEPETA